MSEHDTDTYQDDTATVQDGGGRMFGGLTPAEASRRAAVARSERARQRAAEHEFDVLTLEARLATALAERATKAALVRVLDRLLAIATGDAGASHQQEIAAARALERWLASGIALPEGEDGLDAPLAEMTRAQRAAYRAWLEEQRDVPEGHPAGQQSAPASD